MKYLYHIYQLFIATPIIIVFILLIALVATIGCTLGNGHFWGYYPGGWWERLVVRVLLSPMEVEEREHLEPKRSYVLASNHQGVFDIFLICGLLGHNLKWTMKHQLCKMPFIGRACTVAYRIFADKHSPGKTKEIYDKVHETLQDSMSLVVFPEGLHASMGHTATSRREAFMLVNDPQSPIVPLIISGSFNIIPRTRNMKWVFWYPLRLTIHEPIVPKTLDAGHINQTVDESHQAIMNALAPEYQGFVEDPDQ